MVLTAFFIVVLIGVGSFAIDLGRLFVLKSQMQNAVDAAALAAAVELDGQAGARARAVDRAQTLLAHNTNYTNDGVQALLAAAFLPYNPPGDTAFIFYSEIDPEPKTVATGDADASYVHVFLDTRNIDLYFLPVLRVIGIDVDAFAGTTAIALAGTQHYVCDYPPLMMCDPFEGGTTISGVESFEEAATTGSPPYVKRGDMFVLKYQNKSWAPGDFAFLLPGTEEDGYLTGAKNLGEAIGNPQLQECTAGPVHTATGSVQSFPINGMNTRFDEYGHPSTFYPSDFPPSPVVIEYPKDSEWKSWDAGTNRFGKGETWDVPYRESWEEQPDPTDLTKPYADEVTYWERYHERQGHGVLISSSDYPGSSTTQLVDRDGISINWEDATRFDIHQWEINSGYVPCNPWGVDGLEGTADDADVTCPPAPIALYPNDYPTEDPYPSDTENPIDGDAPMLDGFPTEGNMNLVSNPLIPFSDANRRMMTVAVIPCEEQGINGSKPAVAEAFAEFFIMQRARQGGSNKIDYIGEFQGFVGAGLSDKHHTVVQLYE